MGVNFYQLIQIDFDGSSDYTDVVAVVLSENGTQNVLKAFPNPVQGGILNIVLSEVDERGKLVSLYDQFGRLVKTKILTNTIEQLFVNDLPSGIYWLSLSINGTSVQKKIVLQ